MRSFLQHIGALFGSKIKEAFSISGELQDNLQSGSVILYHKKKNKGWVIRMDAMKYNGEKILLEMPPNSAFGLAVAFLEELGELPLKDVDAETIKTIKKRSKKFQKKFLS